MSVAVAPIIKEIYTTMESKEIVGGRLVWEEIMEKYPDKLIPFRCTGQRGDCLYHIDVIRQVIALAQIEGTLDEKRSTRPKRK